MIRLPRKLGRHATISAVALLMFIIPVAPASGVVPSGGGGSQPSPIEEVTTEPSEQAPTSPSSGTTEPGTTGADASDPAEPATPATQSPAPEPTTSTQTPTPTAPPPATQEPTSTEADEGSLVSTETSNTTWVWGLIAIGAVLGLGLLGFAVSRRRLRPAGQSAPRVSSEQSAPTSSGKPLSTSAEAADDSWATLTESEREAFRRTAEEFGWS